MYLFLQSVIAIYIHRCCVTEIGRRIGVEWETLYIFSERPCINLRNINSVCWTVLEGICCVFCFCKISQQVRSTSKCITTSNLSPKTWTEQFTVMGVIPRSVTNSFMSQRSCTAVSTLMKGTVDRRKGKQSSDRRKSGNQVISGETSVKVATFCGVIEFASDELYWVVYNGTTRPLFYVTRYIGALSSVISIFVNCSKICCPCSLLDIFQTNFTVSWGQLVR